MVEKKIFNKDRALTSFDDFYGNVYGIRWKSMRLAMLCEHKYIAMVNNFGDPEKTCELLEKDGAINIRSIYEIGKRDLESMKSVYVADKFENVGKKIGSFLEHQKDMEMSTIYPDHEHGQMETHGAKSEVSAAKLEQIDYKKPLEKVIEEDSAIEYERLIDPEYGTTGLHEFIPATKIKGMEDWVFESDHYRYYSNTTDFPLKIDMEYGFKIPENLQLYTYENGNVSTFRNPRKTSTGVFSHFLMDGASILPPLVLNVQPGDYVYDACAAPGGKSLLMLQTHLPKLLVSNDIIQSRANRIRSVMNQFVYDFSSKWDQHRCTITEEDARNVSEFGVYDKVLVDVPCTTDRHVMNSNDNNIFKPTRTKERLRLPELQAAILTNCIRLLKPGGSLVYSTCSLSPVQNDGVVHMAMSTVFKEHGITLTINDLSLAMQPLGSVIKFEHPKGLKYGQMVIPFLPANFGPMYFCKMTRH